MSFSEQERVMFHLLFDDQLRQQFSEKGISALSAFQLDTEELEDFSAIRPSALAADAIMRANLILSQMCRSFPMSFSLLSSFGIGFDHLKMLVDVQTMEANPIDRARMFGERLKQLVVGTGFDSEAEQALLLAVLDTELGMNATSASLKQTLQSGQVQQPDTYIKKDGWETERLKLAYFLSATMIPCSLEELKTVLCPVPGTDMWNYLKRTPLNSQVREELSYSQDHRFLVCRAEAKDLELCEPAIEHRTVELPAGFAQLLQHINGKASVDHIITNMKIAGAPPELLGQIRNGFEILIEAGMLVVIH